MNFDFMKVSGLRIAYVVGLVVLGVLVVFTVFRPMMTGGEYTEVQREQLLQTEDEWIIQFNIINHEGKDTNYTINVQVDSKPYNENVLIRDGSMFVYIHHIPRDMVGDGEVTFTIYKEDEDTPFEQVTYHLG